MLRSKTGTIKEEKDSKTKSPKSKECIKTKQNVKEQLNLILHQMMILILHPNMKKNLTTLMKMTWGKWTAKNSINFNEIVSIKTFEKENENMEEEDETEEDEEEMKLLMKKTKKIKI